MADGWLILITIKIMWWWGGHEEGDGLIGYEQVPKHMQLHILYPVYPDVWGGRTNLDFPSKFSLQNGRCHINILFEIISGFFLLIRHRISSRIIPIQTYYPGDVDSCVAPVHVSDTPELPTSPLVYISAPVHTPPLLTPLLFFTSSCKHHPKHV